MNTASISRYWSEDAENYDRIVRDELSGPFKALWQRRLSAMLPARASDVLDFGCGPGFFSVILSELGHRVTGADISAGMLERAREAAARHCSANTPRFVRTDGTLGQFPSESFDAIVSRNVTWTLLDPRGFYREARRVLRPGGVLVVYDANWQLPLFDKSLMARCKRREQLCLDQYGSTFDGPAISEPFDPAALPLSSVVRPAWDEGVLEKTGFAGIRINPSVIGELWSQKEQLLYGETPMFEIVARV
jgi:SAM-dependent methyltransferase